MVKIVLNTKNYIIKMSFPPTSGSQFFFFVCVCLCRNFLHICDLISSQSLQLNHILYKGSTVFVTWMTHNVFNSLSVMGIQAILIYYNCKLPYSEHSCAGIFVQMAGAWHETKFWVGNDRSRLYLLKILYYPITVFKKCTMPIF